MKEEVGEVEVGEEVDEEVAEEEITEKVKEEVGEGEEAGEVAEKEDEEVEEWHLISVYIRLTSFILSLMMMAKVGKRVVRRLLSLFGQLGQSNPQTLLTWLRELWLKLKSM